MKAALIKVRTGQATKRAIAPVLPSLSVHNIEAAGNADSVERRAEKVRTLIAAAGLRDPTAISTKALVENLGAIETIARMIASAEARRNAVLREIDRRRNALAARLRRACADVEEAEFQDVPPKRTDASAP